VIAPHFFAVHAFVFLIFGPATRGHQEHRMRRSVVDMNPAPNSARAGGVASAAEQNTRRSK
jgi:hypothetical protein